MTTTALLFKQPDQAEIAENSFSGRQPRKLKVLYLSFTGRQLRPYLDPSTRYRCFYPVEELRKSGHLAFVATQDRIPHIDPCFFDVIVVHRPSFDKVFCKFIETAKASGVRCFADYDDLIFNPKFAFSSSMFKANFDPTSVADTFRRNTDALHLFERFTTSTKQLGRQVTDLLPNAEITIMPNSVPKSLQEFVEARVFSNVQERKFLGYFPGTKTHDVDFSVAADAVKEFCVSRNVPLLVVGPLELPSGFDKVVVHRHDIVPFEDMFSLISRCRVVIAPLEDTVFNQCKSHIKLLEASLACTTMVYSNVSDMQQHNQHAPFAADDSEKWLGMLQEAWDQHNPQNNKKLQKYFFEKFSTKHFVDGLLDRNFLGKAA